MKRLKRLWYKVWFNKKDGMLLGINPRSICSMCPHYQAAAQNPALAVFNGAPASPQFNTLAIVAADLDKPILDIINKPSDIVLAHAELQIWEPEPH